MHGWVGLAVAACVLACQNERPKVVRVGVIQTAGVAGSVEANADHAAGLVREAAARGTRYILLPELYALFPAARAHAGRDAIHREAAESGDMFTRRMVDLATELDVNIAFGKPDQRDGALYNALVFVEPSGVKGWYAKRWLLSIGTEGSREVEVFTPGPKIDALEWGGIRVGPLICSDGGGGEYWDRLRYDGAEIVM